MSTQVPQISLFRSLLDSKNLMKNPIPIIKKNMEKFGSDNFRVHLGLNRLTLMTQDPEIIEHVLLKNHKNYHKSEIQSKLLARYLGKGLLTSNGKYWLQQRRLIQPGFHKKNLESFLKIMHDEILDHIEALGIKDGRQNSKIDITQEMSALAMRVVSRSLFSSGVSDKEIAFIGKAIDHLQNAIIKDIRLPFLDWYRTLTGENSKNKEIAEKLYSLLREKINERKDHGKYFGDLLDMLLSVKYEDTDEGMEEQQIIDEILVLYAAGYETTAISLGWTFTLIDSHPQVYKKLLLEIDNINLEDEITLESLRDFSFTSKVISESLRLYSPAWIIDRIALSDDKVKDIIIPKDEIISIYVYGVHHSKKYWKNPEQFIPERFDPENLKGKPKFCYFPFGGGPRLCIGNQFAKMEMTLVIYYILKKYKLSVFQDQSLELNPLITLKPKNNILMHLESRN